jgi:hypothetical protein
VSAPPVLPDVKAVRLQAKLEWEATMRRRQGIQERVGHTVPFWLIGITTVFYLLSAPHTAGTFDLLTPGWGWAAPIGVELGTIYVAFRRYQLRHSNERVPLALNILGIMVVAIAFVVNGAGALAAVVDAVGLSKLPFADIVARFGELPVTSQVALLLVPLAAVVIPLGALVAGEGLAALILERRERGDFIQQEWAKVRIEIEFEALMSAAVQSGISPVRAANWAAAIVKSDKALAAPEPRLLTAENGRDVQDGQLDSQTETPSAESSRTSYAIDQGKAYLSEHPEAESLSVRAFAEAAGIKKSSAAKVLAEYKQGKQP